MTGTVEAGQTGSSPFKKNSILTSSNNFRRQWVDRIASRVVTFGGMVIIFSIMAILLVIMLEALPLFKSAEITLTYKKTGAVKEPPMALGIDEYQQIAYVIDAQGIHFYTLPAWTPVEVPALEELGTATVTGVSHSSKRFAVLGLSDGRVLPVKIIFESTYKNEVRAVFPGLEEQKALPAVNSGQAVSVLAYAHLENGYAIASAGKGGDVSVTHIKLKRSMTGAVRRKVSTSKWTLPVQGELTALALDESGKRLLAGTSSGQILQVNLEGDDHESSVSVVGATESSNVAVVFIQFLNGGYTLIVGDSEGNVRSYQLDRANLAGSLKPIHAFSPHAEAVTAISHSLRDKGFFTAGKDGKIQYRYATTGETQYSMTGASGAHFKTLAISPKNNGLLAVDSKGDVYHWTLDNPHPSVSFKALFGKIWYEGYSKPEYTWQSTGGSDEFEPKYSLIPLIYGTAKGTFYAMLFALPLALLSAFYASQFMNPRLREITKPTVELMATLPTVALGFVGALIIAPLLEEYFVGFVLFPVVSAAAALLGWAADRKWKISGKLGLKPGMEMIFLIPLVLGAAGGSILFGGFIETQWMAGDFKTWALEVFNVQYDQRNTMVVGIAMGFAVVPLIFTIAEDSLSNVPSHLKAGSLALGATPWQTAVKVILPVALPGIFSAVMIGFGRAIGETMIVLMATGNTPIMDMSVFNGFRAMSANIAVELPEAPEGGTLYRILFLMAFLLFVFTFIANTIAEIVRLKLREKFKAL
ncbi:MAG: ABC transporter permease [Nitrospinae bacterium CG11_big_fil_rev_8_21_14_0_20_45_15]|nr:MAG: ABC transporter permease [Nitrospinae bacterium CG11_big_fil_rev_8_21_14_0_20_45_15]